MEYFAPPNFHGHKDLFAFISSSQTHLEISLDKMPLALNVFSKLDFIETLLFANSKLDTPEGIYYSGRHYIYSRSAFQKANLVGSIDEIVETIDDIVELYAKKCLFLRYRDKWEFIKPISLKDYFGENVHEAKAEDLNSFYSYCNTELKVYGTLERRGACSQAFDNALAPSAFNLGLGIMIEAVEELLNKFFHDNKIIFSNNELCELSAKRNLDWIQHKKLNDLISAVLMMAEAGLKQRGYGEEKYLKNVGRFF